MNPEWIAAAELAGTAIAAIVIFVVITLTGVRALFWMVDIMKEEE